MILLVGGIVGVIVISMYLPLFSIYNSIHSTISRPAVYRSAACIVHA